MRPSISKHSPVVASAALRERAVASRKAGGRSGGRLRTENNAGPSADDGKGRGRTMGAPLGKATVGDRPPAGPELGPPQAA